MNQNVDKIVNKLKTFLSDFGIKMKKHLIALHCLLEIIDWLFHTFYAIIRCGWC